MSNHLSNIINEDSSIRVAHGDLSARMSPSDPVEGRASFYCDASAGNLGHKHKHIIYLFQQTENVSILC